MPTTTTPSFLDIFRGILRSLEYRVEPATEEIVAKQLATDRMSGAFGNARAVRNLTERAIRQQAARINACRAGSGSVPKDELVLLRPEDFADAG